MNLPPINPKEEYSSLGAVVDNWPSTYAENPYRDVDISRKLIDADIPFFLCYFLRIVLCAVTYERSVKLLFIAFILGMVDVRCASIYLISLQY